METANDFNRYGLATMIGWNVLLVVLILIVSIVKGVSMFYIFNDGTGGVGMSIFLLIWSLIWYGIGYKSRKDFITTRSMYREQVPLLEQTRTNTYILQDDLLILNTEHSENALRYQIVEFKKNEMAWQMEGTEYSGGTWGSEYKHFKRK